MSLSRHGPQYCVRFWAAQYTKNIELLERARKRATKMEKGLEGKEPRARRQKEECWPSPHGAGVRGDAGREPGASSPRGRRAAGGSRGIAVASSCGAFRHRRGPMCLGNARNIICRLQGVFFISRKRSGSVACTLQFKPLDYPVNAQTGSGIFTYIVNLLYNRENNFARIAFSFSDHDSDDDSYEVLDLTEYARRHHWWNRLFGRNSGPIVEKYSVATQIVMGGLTGWCAGFLFQKVGKLAATAVGGGFLLLQIASHSGYVQVDWKRVEKDVNKAKKQLKKRANKAAPEINTLIEESTEFIKQNIVVSSGFVGGFLLGLAS
ncbi:PREDICTED: FUN14 domain-containing protein 1 [Ficedula albicollis]|nr:PREDICTED: FUN14 domain-containing protein 1 [Ficedula albicollis]